MITVMGATGHTGREVTRLLLEAGEDVRALARSASGLTELEDAGAQPFPGDATDPAYLTEAFGGADAVYVMFPSDPRSPGYVAAQRRLGEAVVTAIPASGVRHVVALSAVGADQPWGTGFLASLHEQERRLRSLTGTNVLVLRAGSFFENFYAALEVIEHEGVNADSVAPDVGVPMIASCDIAAVAARALVERAWSGFVVRELLGERDLSYAEATSILGARIGRPELAYVRLFDRDMVAALTEAGFAEDYAELHVELNRALSDGTVASLEGRTPQNTTPTRFEDFAAELAATLQAA